MNRNITDHSSRVYITQTPENPIRQVNQNSFIQCPGWLEPFTAAIWQVDSTVNQSITGPHTETANHLHLHSYLQFINNYFLTVRQKHQPFKGLFF